MPDTAVMNPFLEDTVARSYDKYRPPYHQTPIELISQVVKDTASVLDVACGSGHSTEALSKVFRRIVGCDNSPAMLKVAREKSGLTYVEADATKLPFSTGEFSLVTVFQGFHWIEQEALIREAARVLSSDGFLALDTYAFNNLMYEEPEFKAFHEAFYAEKFPAIAKSGALLPDFDLSRFGFDQVLSRSYEHRTPMTLDQFSGYMMTLSNLIHPVKFTRSEVPRLLTEAYSPFFNNRVRELSFAGRLVVYRRRALG